MIHELHIEDPSDFKVTRSKIDGSYTTKIHFQSCCAKTLIIVIPDGDILDELADRIMRASHEMHDIENGYPPDDDYNDCAPF